MSVLFPSRIAPAPRNRVTTVASGAGTKAFRPFVPPVLIYAGGIKIILDRDWHAVQGPLSSLRPSLLDPCDTRADHLLA